MIHARNFAGLPTCLAGLMPHPRWVGWKWEERKGKRTKPPHRATGGYAHNDKPET